MTAVLTSPETIMLSLPDVPVTLLLARLLVANKQAPAPSRVRADLGKFLERSPSAEQFQDWADQLRAAGLVTEKRLQLTEAGRERALACLGTTELPLRCTWQTIQARYLVPRALGLNSDAAETRTRIDRADKLAALLLKRRFKLPVGTGMTLRDVLQALACRELGFPDQTSLEGVKNLVLNRMLRTSERLSREQLERQLPRLLLGATKSGIGGLRDLVMRRWATDASDSVPSLVGGQDHRVASPLAPVEFDLAGFANTVKVAARDCPTGRFGDNKVFINHVWRHLAGEPGVSGLDLDTFKQKLVEANRTNLLTLSRADLVSVMNTEDVQESETHYLNAVFHFILIEKEQP
jgi:hypothetical protein